MNRRKLSQSDIYKNQTIFFMNTLIISIQCCTGGLSLKDGK